MQQQRFYWSVVVTCARCGETGIVGEPGQVPAGWVGIMLNERMPAIARTSNEAVAEEARYEIRPYPCCSTGCGAKLLITKALELVRTKAERIALQAQLKKVLDGDGGVQSKPN